jgi:hypothetical protein
MCEPIVRHAASLTTGGEPRNRNPSALYFQIIVISTSSPHPTGRSVRFSDSEPQPKAETDLVEVHDVPRVTADKLVRLTVSVQAELSPLPAMGTLITDSMACNDVQLIHPSAQHGAEVDVVAVRLLSGHPKLTSSKFRNHWHHDCLYPEELQSTKSRILIYGHNLELSLFGSDPQAAQEKLGQQARSLLTLLNQERISWRVRERTIIFIAQGVSGMLVEHVLRTSENHYWKLGRRYGSKFISYSTYAVFLFGSKSTAGWAPRSWDPMNTKQITGFDDSEQNRRDIEAYTTPITLPLSNPPKYEWPILHLSSSRAISTARSHPQGRPVRNISFSVPSDTLRPRVG